MVNTKPNNDAKITIPPMVRLSTLTYLTVKCVLILSIRYESPNHHPMAPANIDKNATVTWNGSLLTNNAKRANRAIKRKMMSGFERVTKKAVTPLWSNVPFSDEDGRKCKVRKVTAWRYR